MNDGLFPSALRELRNDLTARPVIVGLVALGMILGISGPFDTWRVLPVVPRMIYWVCLVAATFAIGSLVSSIAQKLSRNYAKWIGLIVSSCCIGVVITIFVDLVNFAVFGAWHETWLAVLAQLGIVTMISAVVQFGISALGTDQGTIEKSAPLLNRLTFANRGHLVSLGAEDHYVRVTTTQGSELILLRLSDAMTEVGSTKGLQIHRSHWVALDQIKSVTRNGDRGEVVLLDETVRPISRGYMSFVREAGLLPKKA